MIVRRIVLALVLTLLAAVTIGVIVGLDEDTRNNLAHQLPNNDPVVSPSQKRPSPTVTPGSATPSKNHKPTPSATSSSATSSPRPTGKASASPTSSSPAAVSPKPGTSSSSPAKPGTTSTTKPKKTKVVYLTFDDGPSDYTPQILKVLRATNSTATFFELGVNRPGHKKTIAAITAQGSNIGNHSYNHPDLTRLSNSAIQGQLRGGPKAKCFRPPYGATDARVRQLIKRAGMKQVLWTVDTEDWQRPGVSALQRIGKSSRVKNHGIILMHDGGGPREQTVAALPKLIKSLQARGFEARALPYC